MSFCKQQITLERTSLTKHQNMQICIALLTSFIQRREMKLSYVNEKCTNKRHKDLLLTLVLVFSKINEVHITYFG